MARQPWNVCEKCGGGIRSLSLYSGKCQKCQNTEKRIKRIKDGEIVGLNDLVFMKGIMRSLK